MEGFCWNGIGEENPAASGARKHDMINVGGLFAQVVGSKSNPILDVVVAENHSHWQVWRFGEPFDIDRFLSKVVFYQEIMDGNIDDGEHYPHPRRQEKVDPHTLTSDYVSRINVLQLICAVNKRWNWHTGDGAITKVVVPRRDLSRGAFHLLERFDVGEFTIERDWEEIQKTKKIRKIHE